MLLTGYYYILDLCSRKSAEVLTGPIFSMPLNEIIESAFTSFHFGTCDIERKGIKIKERERETEKLKQDHQVC